MYKYKRPMIVVAVDSCQTISSIDNFLDSISRMREHFNEKSFISAQNRIGKDSQAFAT